MTKKQTLLVPSLEALRGAQALTSRGATAEDVEAVIYEERVSGRSIREIALMFQRTADEVEQVIAAMAEASRKRIAAEMSIATIVELDRLDALMATLWTSAKGGDVGCIDRVVNISKERRKLLGLDAASAFVGASDGPDLSRLTLDEIKALEALQAKLAAPRATPEKTRAAPQDGSRSSSGPDQGPIIEAEVIESPPKPSKRTRRAPPGSSPESAPGASGS